MDKQPTFHALRKTHIEHTIRLIKHKVEDLAQRDSACKWPSASIGFSNSKEEPTGLHEVDQATRSCNHDMNVFCKHGRVSHNDSNTQHGPFKSSSCF
jgi:hypothetical protein